MCGASARYILRIRRNYSASARYIVRIRRKY